MLGRMTLAKHLRKGAGSQDEQNMNRKLELSVLPPNLGGGQKS